MSHRYNNTKMSDEHHIYGENLIPCCAVNKMRYRSSQETLTYSRCMGRFVFVYAHGLRAQTHQKKRKKKKKKTCHS